MDLYSPVFHELGSMYRMTSLIFKLIPPVFDSLTRTATDCFITFTDSITLRAFSLSVLLVDSGPVTFKPSNLKDALQETFFWSLLLQSCTVRFLTALEERFVKLLTTLLKEIVNTLFLLIL